jgi:hypothetical protein
MSQDTNQLPADTAEAEQAPAKPRKQWNLSWMEVPTQRGIRPEIGPDGLTLASINVGTYAEIPDRWPRRDDVPRGAVSVMPATPSVATVVDEKAELWSENAADLYEGAIRDRWVPATELPWTALRPLSEPLERAICQLCTRIGEESLLTQQVIGRWLERLSYGYHEVKMYLATQVFDAGRHFEAFRKRALANGGGLGIESPGIYNRTVNGALRFSELVLFLHVMRGTTTHAVLTMLETSASDDCERELYRLCSRDLKRHVAFGTGHLRFHLEQRGDVEQIHFYLDRAENAFAIDQTRDPALAAALRILAGRGGLSVATLRKRQIEQYLAALDDAGLDGRRDRMLPAFQSLTASAPAA